MKLKISKNLSIYLMLVGYLLIQIANPFAANGLVSLGTYIIAFAAGGAFLYSLLAETHVDIEKHLYAKNSIRIGLLLFFAIVSLIYANMLSWKSIVSLICFLEIPLFMVAYNKLDSKAAKMAIYIAAIILSFFYIYLSFSPVAYRYVNEFGAGNIKDLTLGYNNPNETAMHLFSCFALLGIMFKDIEKKIFKFAILLDFLFCFGLIIKTSSRTMIVLSVVVLLYTLIYTPKVMKKSYIVVAFAMPILFIVVSLLFPDVNFMGDALDTDRTLIFARVFQDVNGFTFLFGNYNFKFDNLHNGYISIFGTLGLVGLILYVSLLFNRLKDGVLKNGKMGKNIAKLGLLVMIVSTSTEAAMLTAGSAFAAPVISVYLLSVYNNVEVSEK